MNMKEGIWNKNISKGEKEAMKKAFSDKFEEIEKNPKLKKNEDFESESKEIDVLSEEIMKLQNEIEKLREEIIKSSKNNNNQKIMDIAGPKFIEIGRLKEKIEQLRNELLKAMIMGGISDKIELKTIKSKLEQEIVNLEKEIQKLEKDEINSDSDIEFQEKRNLKQGKIEEMEKKENKLKKIEDYLMTKNKTAGDIAFGIEKRN